MAVDIHLVDTYSEALDVAGELGARGIGHDIEGELAGYVGNSPTYENARAAIIDGNVAALHEFMRAHPDIEHGLITNNTNKPLEGRVGGFVDYVSNMTGLPYVHKGMVYRGAPLASKPAGEQGKALARTLEVDPADMVLIDDQGVKNVGEAVRAGYRAIVVPNAVGSVMMGRVMEHPGVMTFRPFERLVFKSLEGDRHLARLVLPRLAGVDVDSIGDVIRHPAAAQGINSINKKEPPNTSGSFSVSMCMITS